MISILLFEINDVVNMVRSIITVKPNIWLKLNAIKLVREPHIIVVTTAMSAYLIVSLSLGSSILGRLFIITSIKYKEEMIIDDNAKNNPILLAKLRKPFTGSASNPIDSSMRMEVTVEGVKIFASSLVSSDFFLSVKYILSTMALTASISTIFQENKGDISDPK